MEQYAMYLRKSRFDRDYAEMSVEETLKRHKAILNKIASDRGYYIAQVFYEVVSGESIASRPEVQKLLEEVSAGVYAGVLVVDVERLARGNSVDQAYISQVFQFSATRIITPGKIYDPTNEFDEEFFEYGLFMSRREYKTINRRLVRGRESSAAEGKYVGSIAPYGYRRIKIAHEKGFTLEIEPEEAMVIEKIFEMYVQGKGTKEIANYLNDNDIPTRHGDLWTYSTLSNIINNPVYMGKIRRGWSKQVKKMENGMVKKQIKRTRRYGNYPVFDGVHPALISEEIFMLAQQISEERAPEAKVKEEFILKNAFAGLLFCSVCGKRIGRTTMSAKANQRERLRCVNMRNCHNGTADYDVVEKEIISALSEWYDGYKIKIDTIGFADDIAECKIQLRKLKQDEDKLKSQLDNAFDLVEQGVYTLAIFQERRAKIEDALEKVRKKQEQIEMTLHKFEANEESKNSLLPQTEQLLDSYDEMTVEERNKLLKEILERIEYCKRKDGKIEIDLYPKLPKL